MDDLTLTSMALNVSLPEPQTMQKHLASANPHPQYLMRTSLVEAFSNLIHLDDLGDVTIDSAAVLQNQVLTFTSGTWTPQNVSTLVSTPAGTYTTAGIVKFATSIDVSNDVSAAITPSVMKTYVSNYVENTHANLSTYGTVRLVSTASDLASAITHGEQTGLVEQVDFNRYVNVHLLSNNSLLYYSTYNEPVSNVAAVDNSAYATYAVYRDGVVSGHVNSTNLNHYTYVASGGNMYDIHTCGRLTVSNNGAIHRLTMVPYASVGDQNVEINDVTDMTFSNVTKSFNEMRQSAAEAMVASGCAWAQIEGTAHEVYCSASNWMIAHNVSGSDSAAASAVYHKCMVTATNHGHIEYATVTGTGQIFCDATGVVEHVVVRDTQSDAINPDHYGLAIRPGGKGYHITLNGDYARAAIQGYAQDVRVYSGCHLDLHANAVVEDLVLYNGAYLMMTSGAKVDGLVQYPGATIMIDDDPTMAPCEVKRKAACHEPDKYLRLVYGVSTIISSSVVSGEIIPTQEQTYQLTSNGAYVGNLTYSDALLFTSANFTIVKDDNPVTYVETKPEIVMYSTDTPRILMRTDSEQITSALNATDPRVYSSCMDSAYQCFDAKIMSCVKANELQPAKYAISAPAGIYEDLHDSAAVVNWKVIF